MGEGEYELAKTRFNLCFPLLRLNRLGEAQQVLERSLTGFRDVGDLSNEANALSALADLWNERKDREQDSMRQAAAAGRRYELPRLADLLERPEFEPLQRTLAERGVAVEAMQGRIDELVEEVRREVEAGGG